MIRRAGVVLGMLFLAHGAVAQFVQQGSKLVGTGTLGAAQGQSVAIAADGNTAIVGGPNDNVDTGAAWVFTRSSGVWSQQGNKLVCTAWFGGDASSVAISADGSTAITGGSSSDAHTGTSFRGACVFALSGGVWSQQGDNSILRGSQSGAVYSVALSADGNTAIVGGTFDTFDTFLNEVVAAWVFTRSGGVWSLQGDKLVVTDTTVDAYAGYSAAISWDGNTAIVGGPGDNSNAGAAWVFTRSGGVWSQQGSKLVGSGAVGPAEQGSSVAISGDGNTAVVGGLNDNPGTTFPSAGAAWVFTRSGGVWSQQGSKLVGTGAIGNAAQGWSVGISGDGNTAVVGGPRDNSSSPDAYGAGAAWVFTRSGGVWSQLGNKLVGTDAVGPIPAAQGTSVAISGDGKTVIVGGPYDNSTMGAAWVFVSCAAPSITLQPQSRFIASGQTATLSVTATGTAPLSFQWYQGDAGDTSTPVGGDASTFTTSPLSSTTNFWVRVTNACDSASSAAAMITVERFVHRHLGRAT